MLVTQIELDVIGHKVVDPQAWVDNAVARFGPVKARECVNEKVAKYEAEYDAVKNLTFYKTPAQKRDAKILAVTPTPLEKWETEMRVFDRTMPRWFEDFIVENNMVLGEGRIKTAFDAKIAKRGQRPT